MRVLHLDSERSWRGGQNQTLLLIEGLLDRGINCHLAAPRKSAIADRLLGEVAILELPAQPGLSLQAAWKLARYCRQHDIHIIDAQSSKAHTIAWLSHLFYTKTKIIVHRRVDYKPSQHFVSQTKYMSDRVAHYIAISRAIKDVLIEAGIPGHKISVVHSATKPPKLTFPNKAEAKKEFCKKEDISPELTLIGNVSALTEQKDYPTLLHALAELRQQHPQFYCVIVGDGHLWKELNQLRDNLGLQDSVKFLGFREDVAGVLHALDILALSSQNEGLGTIMLDALQAGCAVAACDVGGVSELIQHEHSGLLAPRKDATAFARNLAILAKDFEKRKVLNQNGLAIIERDFSLERMVEGNLEVYQSLLKESAIRRKSDWAKTPSS